MMPLTREKVKTADLPQHEESPIWVGHHVDNEVAEAAFAAWLESELDLLEVRFLRYSTRRTVMQSLAR